MDLNLLNQAISSNSTFLSPNATFSLEIEKLTLEEQVNAINWFVDSGIVEMNLFVGEKLTDKNYIHFTLVKGSVKLHLGMAYLPEFKKKPQPTETIDILIERAVNHLFQAKESNNLQKNNKSMILYALPLFNEDRFVLNNKYDDRNRVIPERFNSVKKCLEELNFSQYEKFKVA